MYILLLAPGEDLSSLLPGGIGKVILSAALLGPVLGIASLHVLQSEHYGRRGAAGALVSFVGFALLFVGFLGFVLLNSTVFAILLVLGVLVPFIGLILLGIATIRARVLPTWFGVLLIVGYPVAALFFVLFGMPGGGFDFTATFVVLAIFWGSIGYMLLSKGGARSQRPARVR